MKALYVYSKVLCDFVTIFYDAINFLHISKKKLASACVLMSVRLKTKGTS